MVIKDQKFESLVRLSLVDYYKKANETFHSTPSHTHTFIHTAFI